MPIVLAVVAVVEVETGQRVLVPLREMINTGKTKPGWVVLTSYSTHCH